MALALSCANRHLRIESEGTGESWLVALAPPKAEIK